MQLDFFSGLPNAARQGIAEALSKSLADAVAKREKLVADVNLATRDINAIRKAITSLALPDAHASEDAQDSDAESAINASAGDTNSELAFAPDALEHHSIPEAGASTINASRSNVTSSEILRVDWPRDKKLLYLIDNPKKYGYSLLDRARIVEILKTFDKKAVNKVGIKKYGEAIGQALSKLAQRNAVAKYIKRAGTGVAPLNTYYVSHKWLAGDSPLPEYEDALEGLELVLPDLNRAENRTAPAATGAELELKQTSLSTAY